MFRNLLIIALIFLTLSQCRRDREKGDVSGDESIVLSFSHQQILFDTVFTSIGSTTKWLIVYNTSNKAVNIRSISLGGSNDAVFRLNVDGEAGKVIENVFLAGKDSLFLFVDVTIDPNSGNLLPFLIEDSIVFVTNGNVQSVSLLAYGQEAFFITPDHFPTNGLPNYSLAIKRDGYNLDTTWTNKLPIVVYGYVVIDSTHRLTIEQGTQIYFHANSGMWVYRYGQITVNGSLDEPVVFQGDRLDSFKDVPGSWDRIWINDGEAGKDNTFNYATIKNSFIGIQAEHNPFEGFKNGVSANQLNLINTRIENTKFAGIYTLNYKILGQNLLVQNSGNSNLLATGGGAYLFEHCTFANYWRGSVRNTPAVYLTQLYFDFEQRAYREDSMVINFNNSIIYGDQESEFNIEDDVDPGEKINFTMSRTLLKSTIDTNKYGTFQGAILNPENTNIFNDPNYDDFKLAPGSPAIDFGDPSIVKPPLDLDLDGKNRSDGKPDLGVFEIQ